MDACEFVRGYRAKSEDEKSDDFESSTLALVLKQLGAPISRVNQWKLSLGPGFTFSWFNQNSFIHPPVHTRLCFAFKFVDLFEKPAKHPLLRGFFDVLNEQGFDVDGLLEDDLASPLVIFKVYSLGRIVVTTRCYGQKVSFMHVSADDHKLADSVSVYVYRMQDFFKTYFQGIEQ